MENAPKIVEAIRTNASALSLKYLDQSELHGHSKAMFEGKWPGNKPFIRLLREKNVIDEQQLAKFMLIAESSKHTRPTNRVSINLVQLNLLSSALDFLRRGVEQQEG
jgi:hypothetical protein